MDIISILGLGLGLAVLIMMGFKGWGMIPTSIVGALVVVITNRMDLWEALSTHYGTFMKNYAGDYFLMFFLGTLFGALMGSSGAAKSIACKIVDLMGSKRALLIVVITSAVLSYGGVSFAVVVFTLYPIALVLFKEGNVSKRLFPAALFAGCASFTMVGLPGSPQIQNIMPTEVLGTTAYAAPLNGIVVSCIIFALSMVWLEWNDKRLKAAGIGFVPGRKDDLEAIDISDRTGMLPFGLAVIPILFVVLYIFVMQQVLKDAVTWSTNYIVIQSLALGCLLAFALFHKRIHAFRDSVNDAATNSLIALMNTAVVTGFGGVVQGSHGQGIRTEPGYEPTDLCLRGHRHRGCGLRLLLRRPVRVPGGPWSPVCAAVSGAGNRSADPPPLHHLGGRRPGLPTPLRRLCDGQHLHRPDPQGDLSLFLRH